MVLETTFVTGSGIVELTEGLLFAPGARGHDIGLESPGVLARSLRCVEGVVEIEHRFEPRSAYGLVTPPLERDGLVVKAQGSSLSLALVGADDLEDRGSGVGCTFTLQAGDRRDFSCAITTAERSSPPVDARTALEDTCLGWRSWTELHERPEGLLSDEIAFGVRVLQGLTYQQTGAVLAAPVTSLPEIIGREANWDYRYAWLRDSSLVIHALQRATCADESTRYLRWMTRVAYDGESEGDTPALFGVDGERLLHESTLEHLEGYAESGPVRIGNGAWNQRQLDVYGHILDAASAYEEQRELEPPVQRFLCQVASRAARTWRERDHGIWEGRGEPRHHTSSKLQCWKALQKALELGEKLGPGADPAMWERERDAVRAWLEGVWDDDRGVFPAWPESDEIDASMLLFVVTRFLDPADPRASAVVEAVETELGREGLLVRSSSSEDGAFLLCSCWLVQALVTIGEVERAEETLERVAACANDVGLLPEEIDPETRGALGNVPLAISHAGLVAAATAVQGARDERHGVEAGAA